MIFKKQAYHEIGGRLFRSLKCQDGVMTVEQLDGNTVRTLFAEAENIESITPEKLSVVGRTKKQSITAGKSKRVSR